jgi:hypothetical protein
VQRTQARGGDAPTTPDPIEIAMEAEASGVAPSGVAARVLEKQERLIGWQIASERAGFGLKVLAGLAGLAAAMGLGLMMWSAAHSDGLIIEAIEAPPEIVGQGYTGQALAAELQDKLNRMQRSQTQPRPLRPASHLPALRRSATLSLP